MMIYAPYYQQTQTVENMVHGIAKVVCWQTAAHIVQSQHPRKQWRIQAEQQGGAIFPTAKICLQLSHFLTLFFWTRSFQIDGIREETGDFKRKFLQVATQSFLTSFSWTGIFQIEELETEDFKEKYFATQSFSNPLLLDRIFF